MNSLRIKDTRGTVLGAYHTGSLLLPVLLNSYGNSSVTVT